MISLNKIFKKLKIFKIVIFNVYKTYKPLYMTYTILLSFFFLMLYGLSSENTKGNQQALITSYALISLSIAIIFFIVVGLPIHFMDEYKSYKQREYQKYYDDLRQYLTNRIYQLGYREYCTILYVSKELYFITPYNNLQSMYNYIMLLDNERHGKSAGLYKLEEECVSNVIKFFEYDQ